MSGRWIPKVGDHVFHVCEFFLESYKRDEKIPGYDTYGYEIVESVVMRPYRWKRTGIGVESVSQRRLLGSNANNCFYWEPKDFGTNVFRTYEEAIPLAEKMTRYCEEHLVHRKPLYRHWIE